MNISDIRVRTVENAGKLKGIASITIDKCFVVHDIKVLEGADGFFITMPSRKNTKGEFKDIAHPLNTETREFLKTLIPPNFIEWTLGTIFLFFQMIHLCLAGLVQQIHLVV